jgi:MFS transporter, PPP family, 3-phenylpropionic acid transporter
MEKLTHTRFLTFPALEKFDMIRNFYFFIHISFAIIITYLPAYMSASGYSGKQIALLMSIGFVMAFFAPLLIGILADRSQRPALILRILLLLTVVSLFPFLTPGIGYILLLGAYFFYSFFHVPVMGIADSMATAKAKEQGSDYGKIRMWAALGWFIAASGFGIIMDFLGFGPESPWLFAVLIISFFIVFLISLTIKEREPQKKDRLKLSEIKEFLSNRTFTVFLVAVIFHYMSMAPFGQFVGPLVQELGMSQSVLGMTAGMATGVEVFVLFAFGWLSRKFSLETILLMAVIITGIRWFLVSIVSTAVPLILVQGLHGATAGLFIAGAVTLVGDLAPKGMKVSGQMLLGFAGVGVGNLIGTNIAGILFDYFGSIQKTFLVAAFIEIIPAILLVYLIINKRNRNGMHQPG